MSQDQVSITDDDGFWGLILGKKYDNVPASDRTLDRLVSEFYVGRKQQVDARYVSEEGLLQTLRDEAHDEGQRILLSIWAEEKWEQKSSGSNGFELESDFGDEVARLREAGLFVEELPRGLTLIWPSKEVRVTTREEDRVRSRLFEQAHPLFVRSAEDDTVEVRGAKQRVKRFTSTFTESDSVKRIERNPTTQTVIDGLSSIFTDEIESLTLIAAEFRRTYLPNGSCLSLSNPSGVRDDLNSDAVSPKLVDPQGLSELDHLKFRHNKSGKKITLKVHREETGFYFEIEDRYIPEAEKKTIKLLLEDKLGISFDSIYPYDIQLQDSYIFHRILTGTVETYNRYLDDLPEQERDLLNMFLEVTDTDTFECYRCYEIYESEEPDECPKCGNDSFREDIHREVEVDEGAIHNAALEILTEIGGAVEGNGVQLLNVNTDEFETKNNAYIQATFQEVTSAGKEATTHRYEYLNYCLGNGRLPRRINQYLLNSVLVSYGKSYLNGRDDFGTIDLLELLTTDSPDELLVTAIQKSNSQLRKRIIDRANGAYGQLAELEHRGSAGDFDDISAEERKELKAEYGYNKFERDVFYLFKFMFLFTERWGREGETETDGCLVVPESDGYFIASYDPKLTYTSKGYDLDAGEKNKAAWYMLTENLGGALSVSLDEDEHLDAHIFVSNNFREGQFQYVAARVQEWFAQTENDEDREIPVVFLPLSSLLKLYEIFDRHYDPIIEYGTVKSAFRNEITEQFTDAKDGYCAVDDAACDAVEEAILQARKGTTRSRTLKDHSE